jgi:hypothetical protein
MITIFGVWASFWMFNYEIRKRDKLKEIYEPH